MTECNICYEFSDKMENCFYFCKFKVCHKCISKCINLSLDGIIGYSCPCCRQISYNIRMQKSPGDSAEQYEISDYNFSNLCLTSDIIIKRIHDIYESEVSYYFRNLLFTIKDTIDALKDNPTMDTKQVLSNMMDLYEQLFWISKRHYNDDEIIVFRPIID